MEIGKPMLQTKENRLASAKGIKTLTSRVCPQPIYFDELPSDALPGSYALYKGQIWKCSWYSKIVPDAIKWRIAKPRYSVGEIVWMQEPYHVIEPHEPESGFFGHYEDDGEAFCVTLTDAEQKKFDNRKEPYRATSARYMYKSLARHFYEITGIKAPRRIQDISWQDIRAEGVSCPEHDFHSGFCCSECPALRQAFKDLWDSINKARGFGWLKNPWNWLYEYRKVEI